MLEQEKKVRDMVEFLKLLLNSKVCEGIQMTIPVTGGNQGM
jgi:hypothetical protein